MLELVKSPATLRVLLYMLLPLVATVPGVTWDEASGLLTIDPMQALPWLVAGIAAGGGIFAVWGKK